MSEVAVALPYDQTGLYFVGPALLVPAGTVDPLDPTRGIAHVIHRTVEGTILASASRTATNNSADLTNAGWRGAVVYLDITASPNNTQTLTLAIQGKDPVSGKYATLTLFAALLSSTVGATPTTETYAYSVYPGAAETQPVGHYEVQALALPRTWRVLLTHSGATAWSYSVGYAYLP